LDRLKSGWQDIATAPLDDRKIIVTDGLGVYGGAWFHRREAAWLDCDGCAPTHWMPLPKAPAPDAWRYPVLTARGEAIERMARAMRNGKAWPAVFAPKAAEQLAEDALTALEAAAPAPDGLREAIWQAVMLGGDAWGITDRVIALLAAAPAHEGMREAVEIVTEWLAMAEAVPTQTHGVLRYPPISQGELDAIALLAKGEGA
jgi:hypothetical protein